MYYQFKKHNQLLYVAVYTCNIIAFVSLVLLFCHYIHLKSIGENLKKIQKNSLDILDKQVYSILHKDTDAVYKLLEL